MWKEEAASRVIAEVDFLKPYRGYFTDEMYRPYLSKTLVWTVNDLADAKHLLELGAGVITDVPHEVVARFSGH